MTKDTFTWNQLVEEIAALYKENQQLRALMAGICEHCAHDKGSDDCKKTECIVKRVVE